jgi:hypothetical protein
MVWLIFIPNNINAFTWQRLRAAVKKIPAQSRDKIFVLLIFTIT